MRFGILAWLYNDRPIRKLNGFFKETAYIVLYGQQFGRAVTLDDILITWGVQIHISMPYKEENLVKTALCFAEIIFDFQ
jgi:hypothetical protein